MNLEIREVTETDLRKLWEVSYGPEADLTWMAFDGPYFEDPVQTWDEFRDGYGKSLVENPNQHVILLDGKIKGSLNAYWEDGSLKQWLSVGICLYDSNDWNQGAGSLAFFRWIEKMFALYPHLQRVGFVTWSGNGGMMKLGEKLGMTQEARIRKVRFWQGKHWDSIQYGILREEFKCFI